MSQANIAALVKAEFSGLTPTGNAERLMHFDADALLSYYNSHGLGSKLAEAWLVPDVCSNPAGTWREAPGRGDVVFCYSGVPSGQYAAANNRTIEIPPNRVLIVSLSGAFGVLDWRFCQAAPDVPGFPVDHESRFGERIWNQP